jgi:DNA-binding response OmpR family regulator
LLEQLTAFVQRSEKSLLVMTADDARGKWLVDYLGADDVHATVAPGYDAVVAILAAKRVDCMVVDASSPAPIPDAVSMSAGGDLRLDSLPIVLFGDTILPGQFRGWERLARNAVVSEARSSEELLDRVSFFLHRAPASMPERHRKILRELHNANKVLRNKKAMIVDDDMRNTTRRTSWRSWRPMTSRAHVSLAGS